MFTPSSRTDLSEVVLQLMDEANARRVVPDPRAMRYHQRGEECVPVPGTERDDASATYHHSDIGPDGIQDLKARWYDRANYVRKFQQICKSRGTKNGFAYRPVIRVSRELIMDVESGLEKPFDITYYDTTRYITFDKMWSIVENFGKGLRELGLTHESKLSMYLETQWEWLAAAYGAWSQSMVVTTVYSNLGEQALCEAFTETSCGAIVTAADHVPSLLAMMRRGAIPRAIIIYVGQRITGLDTEGFSVKSMEDVVQDGAISSYELNMPTNNDDLALIMYTSGTTGGPKGVMHTYGSITFGIESMGDRLNELSGPYQPGETYVAALPLAHIFEFAVSNIFLSRGSLVCFGNPRTLLSTFAHPRGDYEEFRPIFLIGVPRIFDTFKKAVEAQLAPRGSLERKIFDHAFASKLKSLREGMDTPFWNESVFAPFRNMTGGRVSAMFVGGGPVSGPTQIFVNVIVGPLIQGWGMTETIGNGAKQLVGDLETLTVGPPEKGCEVKLVDTEDYKHTDYPEPRGEICLRGPFNFIGYFKKPDVTAQTIDAEGWIHTGDIAAMGPRGRVRVVSRIKSLAKNSLGEYIAMEAMESLYAHNSLSVPNGACVIVNPTKNYICAVVCTNESKAMNFAAEHRIKGDFPAILKNPEFQKKATESFRETALAAQRGTQEIVRRVRVVGDVWTPENDMLTAAGKLKRHMVSCRYRDLIQELFVE